MRQLNFAYFTKVRMPINLNLSVIKAIKSDELKDLSKEFSEIAIDSFFDEGILREIPIVGTIIGLLKAGGAVRDNIFANKIASFLNRLASISSQERLKLVDRLNENESYKNRVGDVIIEILDRVESEKKPDLIARVFIAFAKEEITFLELQRLVIAIERLPIFELQMVRELHDRSIEQLLLMDKASLTMLTMAGLARSDGGFDGGIEIPTELCKTFIRLNLDK